MNVRNRNYVYMLHAVEKVLDENRPIWEVENRMVPLYDAFKVKLELLKTYLGQKAELTRPYREIREEILGEFANKIVQLAGFLHELSVEKGSKNMTLYTDISRTSLVHGSIQDCLTRSKNILDYAEAMETELSTFSNGMSIYESAAAQYLSFRDNGLMPYDRRNRLRDVNDDIKKILAEIREFLSNRLDKVTLFFLDAAPRFFEKYKLSRTINDIAGGTSNTEEDQGELENTEDEESDASPPASNSDIEDGSTENASEVDEADNTDTDSSDDSDGSEEADY